MLHNVLYVPTFQFRLISVSKHSFDLNASIKFSYTECIIQGHSTKATIPLGSLSHGLYYATSNAPKVQDSQDACYIKAIASIKGINLQHAKLLHLRLGHLSLKNLQ